MSAEVSADPSKDAGLVGKECSRTYQVDTHELIQNQPAKELKAEGEKEG